MRRRFAVALAFCLLALILSGAIQTTLRHGSTVPEWIHTRGGIAAGALCFALGVWCLFDRYLLLRWLGLLVAVSTGVEAMSRAVVIHACFAPLLFTAVTGVAAYRPVRPIAPRPEKSWVRGLVLCLPALVFLQIVLGAASRHHLFGVLPHVAMAVPLTAVTLCVCVPLLRRYKDYWPLRSLAVALLVTLLTGALLGSAVLGLQLRNIDSDALLALATATHVALGALTLAASALLLLQHRRSGN